MVVIRLGVEPLDDVVDRILIETLVQAARNIADVRGGQQIQLATKGMIERLGS